MASGKATSALQSYGQVGVHAGVESASPYRLIQMLMDGALSRIATATGNMKRGEIPQKGENISWAISIIEGLRASLDAQAGGEIATNLDGLYEYMGHRLVEANHENDAAILQDVH